MKIRWLGHSAFVLTSDSGTRILTDPYESGSYGGAVGYEPIRETVEIVTASHDHEDHFCLEGLPEGFECVTTTGKHDVNGLTITGVKTYHDETKGKERGPNVIFVIDVDGLRVCHLGDLGHTLSADELGSIGKVDVLLIPVGGFYTIGPKEALNVMKALSPAVTIPMHFKTESLGFPIEPVDNFLSLAGKHERPGTSEIEITKDDLGARRIIVLEHEL
ncbi:MAG: MBL fold metallo-hydrolase [Candidatus Eisenbacteria bacterium]